MNDSSANRRSSGSGSVVRGAGVNLLGDVLAAVGAPLLYLVVSRVLGAGMLGTYILVTYYIALFHRLSVMGFDKGVLRHIPLAASAPDRARAEAAVLGTSLRWTAVVSLAITAVTVLFPELFLRIGGDEGGVDTAWWLAALATALPALTLCRVALFAVRGLKVMWVFVAVQNLVAPISLIALSLAPMFLGLGPRALALGFVGSAYISAVVAFALLGRHFPHLSIGAVLGASRQGELVRFSWPQGLTETLNFLLGRVDVIMIAVFFPDRPELVAFYGMAALIAGTVKKVRFAFDNSFSPVFADLHARGDTEGLRREYRRVGRWIFSLFVLVGGAVALGSQFILMIYGDSFTGYWLAVPILIAGRLFNAAGGTAQTALLMSGRSRLELANNVLINVGNIALNLVLIPRYHVFGAALATSASLTVFNLVRLVEVAVLLRLWVSLGSALRIAFAGVVAAAPGLGFVMYRGASPLVSLGAAAAFVVIYPLVLLALGDRSDVRAAREAVVARLRRHSGSGGEEGPA